MELMGGVGNDKGKAPLLLLIGVPHNGMVASSGQYIDHLEKFVVMFWNVYIAQELFYFNFTILVNKVRIGQAVFAVLAGKLERHFFTFHFKCRGADKCKGRQIIYSIAGKQDILPVFQIFSASIAVCFRFFFQRIQLDQLLHQFIFWHIGHPHK